MLFPGLNPVKIPGYTPAPLLGILSASQFCSFFVRYLVYGLNQICGNLDNNSYYELISVCAKKNHCREFYDIP